MFLGVKIKNFTQVSKQNNEDMLSLLLITEDEKTHYVLIKDFNRFLIQFSYVSVFLIVIVNNLHVYTFYSNIVT